MTCKVLQIGKVHISFPPPLHGMATSKFIFCEQNHLMVIGNFDSY